MTIGLSPLSSSLGIEITGADLSRPLDEESVSAVREAWLENLVVLFRDQSLADADLVTFSRHIGELDSVPGWEDFHVPGIAEVLVISNVAEDGEPIGVLGAGEAAWHTDMSYLADPPIGSLLYALEIPPSGGDTWFMNMYDALAALPDGLKNRLAQSHLNHDDSYSSNGQLRPGRSEVTDVSTASGAKHPAILVHPETRREALYLGRRLNSYIVGESVADSENLLDEIWANLENRDIVYRHHWRVGDVLMWGQPLHDAPARRVRQRGSTRHAPDSDQTARLGQRTTPCSMCGSAWS